MKTWNACMAMCIALMFGSCSADDRRVLTGEYGTDNTEPGSDTNEDTSEEEGTLSDSSDEVVDSGNQDGDGCSGMDILFVIDDSASMAQEQENLRDNFPQFIDVLNSYYTDSGTPISYKVGVTTIGIMRNYKENGHFMSSEFGGVELDDGLLLGKDTPPEPNCGLQQPWLENTTVGLEARFNCMATVGTAGTVVEMPLAVIEESLGEKNNPGGPNEGFYTKGGGSLLVVVIITDEDDCSIVEDGEMFVTATGASDCDETTSKGLYPPVQTKEFLDELTGGMGRYVVVTIAAKEQCQSEFGQADKAKRLSEFVALCGDNGFFGDICSGNLWSSLQEALNTMQVACREMPPII